MGEVKYYISEQVRAKHMKVVQTTITSQITNFHEDCFSRVKGHSRNLKYVVDDNKLLFLIELVESFAIAIQHPRRTYQLQVSSDSFLKNNLRTWLPFIIL